jgi:hypothetical protein
MRLSYISKISAAGFLLIAFESVFAATSVPLVNPGLDSPYSTVNANSGTISGVIANGWSDNSGWANAAVHYSQETSNCRGGNSCQKIEVASVGSGNVQFLQNYRQQSGNIYSASVWVRGTPGVVVNLVIQQASAPWMAMLSGSITLTGDWQQVSALGYVTSTEEVFLLLGVNTPGTVWVDDFADSYTPGVFKPVPNLGPIPATFFGMHVSNFQNSMARNTGLEPPYKPIGTNKPISGAIADNWYDNSDWASPTVAYSQDAQNPHGGSSSQKIEVTNPGAAVQFVQDVNVISGHAYTLSAWVRGTPGMTIDLIIRQRPEPYTAYASQSVQLTAGWTLISASGVVHDTGDLMLMFRTISTGTFWVDDVSFTDPSGRPVSGGVPWPPSTFGTLRLWDSGTSWTSLEPVKGVWNWEMLDTWVATAESSGVRRILLTLGQSPQWASSQPDSSNYVGIGAPAPPADLQDWRDYITAVGQRYKGRIQAYEIWNEPNDPTYYTGTVSELVDLTREASKILKEIDSDNIVVAPVPYETGYLDQLLTAGLAPWVDVISFHFYTYAEPPEKVAGWIANVRLVMAKHQVDTMPFWDTEGASGDNTTSEEQSPAYLVRRYLVDLAMGSASYNWYTWGTSSKFCPATESDNRSQLTPAGKAFVLLRNWLRGASLIAAGLDSNGTWLLSLTLRDSSPAMIVWNPTASVPFPIPIPATMAHHVFGGVTKLTSSTVTVNSFPILLSSTNWPGPTSFLRQSR